MADIIVEIHGITTSQNLRHPNGLKVAALAIVSTVSKENPQFGLAKRIVAINDHDIGQDLLGLDLTEEMTSIEKIDLSRLHLPSRCRLTLRCCGPARLGAAESRAHIGAARPRAERPMAVEVGRKENRMNLLEEILKEVNARDKQIFRKIA
jgi:hypothetical protein